MKSLAAVLATLALASCSLLQPRPPAFDPVGTYDFSSEFQGQSVPGTMTLRQTPQGLAGSFTTAMTGELPFDGISVTGRKMQLKAIVPDAELVMDIEFDQEYRFTGQWSLSSGLSGPVSGTRRSP